MKRLTQGETEWIRFDGRKRIIIIRMIMLLAAIATVTAILLNTVFAKPNDNEAQSLTATDVESVSTIAEEITTELTEIPTEVEVGNVPEAESEEATEAETEVGTLIGDVVTTVSEFAISDIHGEGIEGRVSGVSDYELSGMYLSGRKSVIESGQPMVLVLHTHASESYCHNGEKIAPRSSDPAKNVISVGSRFAEKLKENGICAIHCTIPFDSKTTMGAYSRAGAEIKNYLRAYPTIAYIVDIHRMADVSEGKYVRTQTNSDGAAQMRFWVGSSDSRENVAFAIALSEIINEQSPICSPVHVGEGTLNHEKAGGILTATVEIGAIGNSAEEAVKASEYLADALTDVIIGANGQKP